MNYFTMLQEGEYSSAHVLTAACKSVPNCTLDALTAIRSIGVRTLSPRWNVAPRSSNDTLVNIRAGFIWVARVPYVAHALKASDRVVTGSIIRAQTEVTFIDVTTERAIAIVIGDFFVPHVTRASIVCNSVAAIRVLRARITFAVIDVYERSSSVDNSENRREDQKLSVSIMTFPSITENCTIS